MAALEYHVKIGQVLVAGKGEALKTVLGSCVGVALIWRSREKIGLAHCLLPEPQPNEPPREGRYVSQAIPKLLELMGATLADVTELEAVVAGGGRMMDVEQRLAKFVVGEENLRVAKSCLKKLRIRIVAFSPGGDNATKMRLDGTSFEYVIESVARAA